MCLESPEHELQASNMQAARSHGAAASYALPRVGPTHGHPTPPKGAHADCKELAACQVGINSWWGSSAKILRSQQPNETRVTGCALLLLDYTGLCSADLPLCQPSLVPTPSLTFTTRTCTCDTPT